MTTAARRPTPADVALAHRIEAGATGREPFRPLWEAGIRSSSMPPRARHVALTLASHTNIHTGRPTRGQALLFELAVETGVHPAQVSVALDTLLSRGWITRTGDDYSTAPVLLSIPAPLLGRLRKITAGEIPVR